MKLKVEGKLERKDTKNNTLSNTIIIGLIGLVLLLIPNTLNKIIGVIIGFLLLLTGIINIYNYLKMQVRYSAVVISGILYSLLGMIILLTPASVIRAVAIGIGISLLIMGFMKIRNALIIKNMNNLWLGTLIMGIVIIILGLLLVFNPFSGIALTKLGGIFLSLVAIFNLIDMYIIQK